jgi:hypothetical protein
MRRCRTGAEAVTVVLTSAAVAWLVVDVLDELPQPVAMRATASTANAEARRCGRCVRVLIAFMLVLVAPRCGALRWCGSMFDRHHKDATDSRLLPGSGRTSGAQASVQACVLLPETKEGEAMFRLTDRHRRFYGLLLTTTFGFVVMLVLMGCGHRGGGY